MPIIKTLTKATKLEKEKFKIPKSVQDAIPIQRIWPDGIFQVGSRFSKTFSFTDINYSIASKDDKTAMFLAFMGISEGAIPFALESPITAIPSYMVGAIVGSTAAVWLGAVQWFPESAIWAWPLVTNLGVYMAGIALGAVITALMVVFLRLMMFRKGKLLIDSL